DPEHQKGLLPDVVDPVTGMTVRQATQGREELRQFVAGGGVEKLAAEFAQADAETQASPEWKQVYSDLKQRYVDAGETENAADSYATLQANAIANLSKNAGMKPAELLALHNPQVTAGAEAPVLHQGPVPEDTAILHQAAAGGFGGVHDEYYHDAKGAVAKLLEEKDGEAPGALHHADVGDIDLVYGKAGNASKDYEGGYGLAKIAAKHPEVLEDLQGFLDGLQVKSRSDNRIVLSNENNTAVVRLTWDGAEKKWLLSAYDAKEKSAATGGTTGVTNRAEPALPAGQEADKDNLSSDDVLHQEGESPRGWFRVLPDGRYEIGKTPIGDFSTFVHEPAHAYLELFRELTQRDGASEPLKGDFRKICEWLGTTPEDAYKNGFTREQHERWAKANEQYVREGNAPTSGLRRAFHNFAVWLGSIYRRAGALGVELNGDIRGVMDRLYAGDTAVDHAEHENGRRQLFETPEDAGWTEDEYRNYAEATGVEVDKAKEQVRRELNEAAQRDQTQERRQERGDVRDAMTEQIDARPEYRAIRSLRRGSLEDGTPLTLNRDALVKQFGEDRVKALQQLHRGLYRNDGGTDAETAAEMFGFGSGEEMMRALENAPRRTPAIEAASRDYLVNRYGDVRYDGTLMDRARFALENQERAGSIYRELKTLRQRVASLQQKASAAKEAMRSIAIQPLEHYQEAARQMIDQKAIADLQPQRYLDASRKFSREAFDALRKGDAQRAADAKNKELLNHFLFREA
ncbi:MAG: hypothetical protein KGL39_59295, partial [Patescibacteria group bacterium]|nr:hypothetical protein [Patescibacteria group bacterium]